MGQVNFPNETENNRTRCSCAITSSNDRVNNTHGSRCVDKSINELIELPRPPTTLCTENRSHISHLKLGGVHRLVMVPPTACESRQSADVLRKSQDLVERIQRKYTDAHFDAEENQQTVEAVGYFRVSLEGHAEAGRASVVVSESAQRRPDHHLANGPLGKGWMEAI